MAKGKQPGDGFRRPDFNKTPFGGVPTVRGSKVADNQLLPGRKALRNLTKSGKSVQDFGRLTPIGSGAINQDILSRTRRSR